jgi:polyisoprenoid-binding protein YceI
MIRSILLAALLLVPLTGPVAAADFVFDKAHTQAEFVVTHMELDRVHGQIPLTSGTASVGTNGIPTAISATFDVTSFSTGNDNRDKNLRDNYFEVPKYPTITFVETGATGTPDAFTLNGNLTIHGVTKPVSIACKVDGARVERGKQHFAYTGTTTIDRRDFGMSLGPIVDGALFVGYPVTINFEAAVAAQ